MNKNCTIKAPFFEIGPKSYLYGDEILELAKAADAASEKYDVDIIFTCPVVDIRRVKENTKRIHVFAPHMDPIPVGRGLADILPESLVAAGAEGVMLNHVEKPVSLMQVVPGDTVETPIWDEYKAIISRYDERGAQTVANIERFAFYEKAKGAYAIIATGEGALYANVILQKGVI